MTSCTTGSRSRRAAMLRLFCAAAIATYGGSVTAQQISDGNDSIDNGVAISDDSPTSSPESLPYAGYDDPDSYDDSAPCSDFNACEPDCADDHCAGWFGAEWLYWQLDGSRLPPLLTAGPSTVPPSSVARLNDPNTQILTDKSVNDHWRDGYRLSGGFWLGGCHCIGIGADYFDVGNDNYNFLSQPNPTEVIGRPFFNTQLGQDDVEFVSI
ncbi:MAG TPA: BBP7 family outer membrane beta-barrel protein, partial [Lacipirellulaceae bacterium]|nr:BBP7 family outer membrane beta-barrel protein [Lacipirellulaceae bacterium]